MASDVNKSYGWGILGCGWLGQAFAQSLTTAGVSCWGTGRSASTLKQIQNSGADAMAWTAGASSSDVWPSCRRLLVAWPPSVGQAAFQQAAAWAKGCEHVVVISSTSVYPAEPGAYREADAIRRKSPHSGLVLLDVEEEFDAGHTTWLRAGGLFGPGRHPRQFLRGRPLANPEGAVNMVHRDDVVRAIAHAANLRHSGPLNVVAPVPTSRRSFYAAAGAVPEGEVTHLSPGGRRVLSNALLETGFTFLHPDPAEAVLQLD